MMGAEALCPHRVSKRATRPPLSSPTTLCRLPLPLQVARERARNAILARLLQVVTDTVEFVDDPEGDVPGPDGRRQRREIAGHDDWDNAMGDEDTWFTADALGITLERMFESLAKHVFPTEAVREPYRCPRSISRIYPAGCDLEAEGGLFAGLALDLTDPDPTQLMDPDELIALAQPFDHVLGCQSTFGRLVPAESPEATAGQLPASCEPGQRVFCALWGEAYNTD
jgi:hypothetical protein